MKLKLVLCLLLVSFHSYAQLLNSVTLTDSTDNASQEKIRRKFIHEASMQTIQKYAPEMGYSFEDYKKKLDADFEAWFVEYQDQMLSEKFGAKYKETLSDNQKIAFLSNLEADKDLAFITYSRSLDILRSHSLPVFSKNEQGHWNARVELDVDKIKLEKQLRKIINGEKKVFSKILLMTQVETVNFSASDLELESFDSFTKPLNDSWLNYFSKNLPSTVEEVVLCDSDCQNFYNQWSETKLEDIRLPQEYRDSVLLSLSVRIEKLAQMTGAREVSFKWDGRAIIQDLKTKRILSSYSIPDEVKTYRVSEQKTINSKMASSIYRSPLTGFKMFTRKLEEKIGFSRVDRLAITGHKNMNDVLKLVDQLKTRGSSLGLEVFLDSFTKNQANFNCFYLGEEKSFIDLLSSIKEVKSSNNYQLVHNTSGGRHELKLVTE